MFQKLSMHGNDCKYHLRRLCIISDHVGFHGELLIFSQNVFFGKRLLMKQRVLVFLFLKNGLCRFFDNEMIV